jgi:hypothetical protein
MVDILPNPNNGTIAFDVDHQALRLSATVNDLPAGGVNSNLAAAEAFIDPVLPVVNGSGITMMPVDGVWNSANEQVFIWIPLSQLNVLATGAHTVAVHGLDTAGNWGALSNTTLVVDRSGPLVSNLAIGPSPVIMRAPQATNAMSATLTASATDPANGAAQASNVTAAEWFDGADPGPGMGSPMSAPGGFNTPSVNLSAVINNLAGWSDGDHILSVRARDVAGNWGDVVTTTLTITSNLNGNILATSFENGLAAWSGVVGNVQTLPQAAMGTDGGTHGMDAVIGSGQGGPGLGLAAPDAGVPQPAYVFDTTPSGEILYHASFFFNPNSANPGSSPIEIFVGLDKRSLPVFGVQFEPSTTQPNYELRAWVMQNGTQVFTDWYDISNAPHQVEIAWQSNSSSGFNLLIDGFLRRSLHGDTSAYTLDSVRLGPSSGLTATATGSLYFDQFNSNRLNAVKYNLHLPVVLR